MSRMYRGSHAGSLSHWLCRTVTGTQCPVNNNENQYGAEAASTQFFCAITSDNGFKKVIHDVEIYFKEMNNHAS